MHLNGQLLLLFYLIMCLYACPPASVRCISVYVQSCGFDESFFPFTANCFRGCCPEGVT